MTRGSQTSHPCISRGTQVGNAKVGNATFEIQGCAIQLQHRLTPGGDSKGPSTPSSTQRRPSFAFRPGSRTGNRAALRQRQAAEKGQNEKTAGQQQLPKQDSEAPQVGTHEEPQRQTAGRPQVSKQKIEQPEEEQQQSNTEPPVVPTWEGGNLRAIRTPQRPGSAASALGLARSASVPNVQRPSSAPTLPSDRELEVEIKKDPAKWYIPANTYRTQYMEDYSDAPVENANGAPRPRSVVEVRQEVDRRQAKQSMTRRPSIPSMADLTAYFYTSESAAQLRKYTEKETSDCRGTMCDWQTSKAEKERTDQVKENLSQLRQSREARKAHRPPKVPLKQDISTPTSSKSSKSKRRPKSLADLLNMQDGHAPVPNRNAKPDDDAVSEATTASAPTKESLSEVCSLDSARTDSSARTTASSVYSSRSSVSCRSSRSSVSTRSSSSSRSSASLRSSSSKRSSSKDSISLASSRDIKKSESERKLEKVSTASVCGSSMD